MKRIIITGATGMIGANLARLAIERGDSVLCIVRPDSKKQDNLPKHKNLTVAYSDISDYANVRIDGSFDCFYHFAWEKTFGSSRDDVDSQLLNVQYTMDAVRLAKRAGCSAFVGAGSQAEYGPVQCKLRGDTPVDPLSGYGIAKYTAGKLSALLCAQLGIRHNWARILSVYGALDNPYTLIMYVMSELAAGRSPSLTKCEQTWDYLNERDAAIAFYAIGEKGVDRKTYVLGSGDGKPLRAYIETIRDIVNPSVSLGFGKKEYYPNQPMYLVADIAELTRDTGWKPEVDFSIGIRDIASLVRI